MRTGNQRFTDVREDQRKLPGGTINEWNIDEPRLWYFYGSRMTLTVRKISAAVQEFHVCNYVGLQSRPDPC